MYFTGHVRLIGITGIGRQICQTGSILHGCGTIQQILKAQHLLKHLWTVADRSRKTSSELAIAYANPVAKLFHSGFRMSGQPFDASRHGQIYRVRSREAFRQRCFESRQPADNTSCFAYL
jgi:hypothetical protein